MCSKISRITRLFAGVQLHVTPTLCYHGNTAQLHVTPRRIHSSVRVFCPYREYNDHSSESYSLVSMLGVSTLVAASLIDSLFDDGVESKEDTLKKHIGMCTMHLHQSEPHLAKPHFQEAYELLKDDLSRTKDTPIPNLKIAYLTDQLGNIALQLECYREAVDLYLATINGFALNGIERSNRTVTELFLKIGQIYAILGDYKQAEMSFLHCVGVTTLELAKSDAPKNPKVTTLAGLAYEGLGKVYLSMNLPENALNMYKHALQFAEKIFEPNDPQIPVLLNDLATVYESLNEYGMALEQVEKAIVKAKVANQAAVPVITCNKATILLFSGDLQSARSLYEELLQTCLRIHDYETIREIKANMKILEEKERLQKEHPTE